MMELRKFARGMAHATLRAQQFVRSPRGLLKHRPLLSLAVAASRRPADIRGIQDLLRKEPFSPGLIDSVEALIETMRASLAWRTSAANLFVAALRTFCEIDLHSGLEFGSRMYAKLPDRRALRSLVAYHNRAGNHHRALACLELMEHSDWQQKQREKLERELCGIRSTLAATYLQHPGYANLTEDPRPTLLLYADVDMNLIDGSSVWAASTAQVLTDCGFRVVFLLKNNIEREHLIEPLRGHPDIEIVEPWQFRRDELARATAIQAIEALDGIHGGYAAIVMRGMRICHEAANCKSLYRRVWAYVTDFYKLAPDSPTGFEIEDSTRAEFADFKRFFARFFVQTPQIADVFEQEFDIPAEQLTLLPPMLPDAVTSKPTPRDVSERPLRIAYAGKITPLWGVLELIEVTRKLVGQGQKIEVHVVGDKIHDPEDEPEFKQRVIDALASPHIVWHRGASRAQTLEILADSHVSWCYRTPALERHTLELSTKLLESVALGLPVVATRNAINENILGADYPLLVDDQDQLSERLGALLADQIDAVQSPEALSRVEQHTLSQVRQREIKPQLQSILTSHAAPKRIVVAGHDLKFVSEFEAHLKRLGHYVKRDTWEWGEPADESRSRYLARWADCVFCEWGLANAVWYSNNLARNKRLVVRIHQQEVVKRARVFPPRFDHNNIDATIFVANHIRDRAIDDFGWDAGRMHMVPNYVNTDFFERDKLPEARFRVAIVGIIPSQHKRFDRAIDLVEKLRERDSRFQLAVKGKTPAETPWLSNHPGESEFYQKQFARLESPHLRGAVSMEGFSPRLGEWYRSVGYVISPSDFESFHYSIAEGVASGALPLVWPWEGAAQTYPSDWLVRDVDEAADRIAKWSTDSVTEMIAENRATITTRYGLDTVFTQLTDLLLGRETN